MRELYAVRGTVNKGFVGQISYTICLEQTLRKLDIEFSFDNQRYTPQEVTPERIQEISDLCQKKYGLQGTPDQARQAILGEMKTEIHTLATLNDHFIGCVHKQLTTRHMTYDGETASEGCIPQAQFQGVLTVTVLVFNVLKDETHYALTVRGECAEGETFHVQKI